MKYKYIYIYIIQGIAFYTAGFRVAYKFRIFYTVHQSRRNHCCYTDSSVYNMTTTRGRYTWPAARGIPHEKYAHPCVRGPGTRLNSPVVCSARLIKSRTVGHNSSVCRRVYIYIYTFIAISAVVCCSLNPGLSGCVGWNECVWDERGHGRTEPCIECPV